jgi:hypothetical protein
MKWNKWWKNSNSLTFWIIMCSMVHYMCVYIYTSHSRSIHNWYFSFADVLLHLNKWLSYIYNALPLLYVVNDISKCWVLHELEDKARLIEQVWMKIQGNQAVAICVNNCTNACHGQCISCSYFQFSSCKVNPSSTGHVWSVKMIWYEDILHFRKARMTNELQNMIICIC